ncbi:MAG: hypothetical protein EU535_03910 [Promethearchaeota archaeon]|nr:MAG: hypothetical protein EU535_03910 [Candidatus Lokiarchaeota archaeon]
MQYFCPKCGETIKPEEVTFYKKHFSCSACNSPDIGNLAYNKQYTIYLCSGCLSYVFDRNPKNALWKKTETDEIDQTVFHILEREVVSNFRDEFTDKYEIVVPPILEIPSIVEARVSSSEFSTEITLLLKQSLCKTCNKLLSRRFDAVIQLRTIKLKSDKIKDLLNSLVDEVVALAKKIQQKNPEQFISDIEEVPLGFDLKLSIKSMMTSIQSHLTNRYAFIVKTSKKLMGKNPNTGGDLYRTYVLLRYIPLQANDVIRIKNTTYRVKKIQANRIVLENMDTLALHTHNFEYFEKNLVERMDV